MFGGACSILAVTGKNSFNPASLSLSGWWRDYAGAPWVPSPSAGTSGAAGNFTTTGSDPTVGALNGHGVAVFNGTTQYLTSALAQTDLFTTAAGSIVALFNASAAHADTGAWYEEPAFLCTNASQEVGLQFSSAGLVAGTYDGVSFNRLATPCGTAAWHAGTMTWNSTVLRSRVDSGVFSTVASGALSFTADNMQSGRSSFLGNFFQGSLVELITSKSVISDADLDNIKSYFNARYGLAL